MFPKCRALLAAPLSDSEEQWVGVHANCDLLWCTIPQLGGRHWDVSVQGMKLKFGRCSKPDFVLLILELAPSSCMGS